MVSKVFCSTSSIFSSVFVDILLIFVQIGVGKFWERVSILVFIYVCKLVYFTNLRGVLGCGALVFLCIAFDM